MAWHIVSFELGERPLDEARLFRTFDLFTAWYKPLLSSWLIDTQLSPMEVTGVLKVFGVLAPGDGVYVLELTSRGDFEGVKDEELDYFLNHRIIRI